MEGAAALGVGKRCARRDVDGELHLAVGGVDALAAGARCLRKPLRQIRGGDDEAAGDTRAGCDGQVLHAQHPTFPLGRRAVAPGSRALILVAGPGASIIHARMGFPVDESRIRAAEGTPWGAPSQTSCGSA